MMRNRCVGVSLLLSLACAVLSSCNSSPRIAVAFPAGTQAMLDSGQSQNFTVTLTHDSKKLGVTWSLASAGTLSNVTLTSVTYNAPVGPITTTLTDHLTATSNADKTKSVTLAITITPTPAITTTSLPAGVNGTAYSQQVAASGGAGTLTFALSGGTSLPAGLSMSSSGLITGTPSGSNVTANFTVTVTDQGTGTPAATASKALSIHIAPAPVLSITTTTLKNGNTNVAYSDTVATTGGIAPVTFSITSGALPHGLALNATTGAITGMPDTTANNFGVFNFTVQATDKAIPPQTPSQALSITIIPPTLSITNATLPNGQVDITYSGTVQGSGGFPPLVYSVNTGSALPNGLSINSATGAITGKPTVANPAATFTIQVKDAAAQVKTQAYTIAIAPAISVALSTPPPATLQATLTAIVAATVTNDAGNLGVDWTVTCGSAACGSFSPAHTASGANTTYTAPAAVPTGNTVTIKATSTADPTKSSSGVTTILPPPIIVTFVMAPPSSLQVTNSVMVSAHVANDGTSAGVDWTLTCGVPGGCGSFTVTHTASDVTTTYAAPATVPPGNTVTVKAASTADPTKFVTMVVTITLAPPISVAITQQPPSSLVVMGTANVTAKVTNDSQNKGVDWTVTCGSAGACGSFNPAHTASGSATVYTAPPGVPTGNTVTITATSTADNTKSANANTVTITPLVVSVVFTAAPPASLAVSGTANIIATVTNDPLNKGVDWTVTCGSAGVCGSFNPAHTASGAATIYTAPVSVPTGTTVTIQATSTADNTKFISANVTITTTTGTTCPLPLGGQEGLLNGTYAILFNGWNDGVGMFQAAASILANGTGGITGGVDDSNGIGVTPKVNQIITSGCYTIGTGGRGTMIWTFSGGHSIGFSIVMRADGKNGDLIEFDDTTGTTGGRGSGSIRKQDTTLFVASTLTGPFGFGVRGEKADSTRAGSLGAFTLDGVSVLSAGAVDYSEPNTSFTGLAATGSFTAPDATHGRGTLTLTIQSVPTIGNLTLHFAYYITRGASGTQPIIYLQSTDTVDSVGHGLQNGIMAKQINTPYSNASINGTVIFSLTGFDTSHSITNTILGLATSSGTGTFTGVADQEADATPLTNQTVSGTISIGANGLGTVQITSPAALVPSSIVMLAQNTAFMLEGTAAGPGHDTQTGLLQPQTGGGTFTTSSLTGTLIFGSDEPATTNAGLEVGTVTVTSPGNITITEDSSDTAGLQSNVVLTGTYTMSTNGRGTITITSGGSGTAVIYLYSTNKAAVMERGQSDTAILNLEQ